METVRKGAEANICLTDGRIIKERVSKAYRIPQLDAKLRRQRTRREAKNLERALELGLKVPKIIRHDEKACIIELEYLDGELVKDLFDRGERIRELSRQIGISLRRLHDGGLVHNDLTTSNLIAASDGVYIIDFGLGYHTERLEDQAMDLVVFKKSIQATHTFHAKEIWDALIGGYGPDKEMAKRVETIEGRVRYK